MTVTSGYRARAKNIILLIGDGMGCVQRDAARLFARAPLVMDALPVHGSIATSCADPDGNVTDSAAAATAIATGVKTRNGAIGVDPEGRPVETVLERAKAAGKATGLITTCNVTDATPAAFAAHVASRVDQREIARQFIEDTGVDLILGGGRTWWEPVSSDDPDLMRRARNLGYEVAGTVDALRSSEALRLLGLLTETELFHQDPPEAARYDPPVPLWELTQTAIRKLSQNRAGFFLMVEEAAIDRMGHRNLGPLTIKAVHELDRAVRVAREFAEEDGETLVIVTADHECGGLALDGYPDGPFDGDLATLLRWATTGHTEADVPLTAMGPHARRLAGHHDNTEVFAAMVEAMGLD